MNYSVEPSPFEKSDNSWQRMLRARQVHWRVQTAGLPAGPRTRKPDSRPVASMLPLDVDFAPNLMTDEAVQAAREAIARLKAEKGPGLINEDRLKRNTLSSQPLCFNVFGYLGAHSQALLPWVRSFSPNAIRVTDVRLEWAPTQGTIGGSAFDAFVEYDVGGGQRGFIGIECKYAEDLKGALRKPAAEKWLTATRPPAWRAHAAGALDVTGLRQFWFNQLLTQTVRKAGGYAEGFGVVVACANDTKAQQATESVAAQLTDPPELRFSSLEDLLSSVSRHDGWKQQVWGRYLKPLQGEAVLAASPSR